MSLIDEVNEIIAMNAEYDVLYVLNKYTWVSSTITDHLRWDVAMCDVITDGKDFVELRYNLPATEYQDTDLDMVARVVYPVQKMVTVYE